LTGTIYGSTLSIPEQFFRPPVQGGYDHKTHGARLKVEVTARLPLHGKPSLHSGWKSR
jgi:hypothetical protein